MLFCKIKILFLEMAKIFWLRKKLIMKIKKEKLFKKKLKSK